MKKGFLSTLLLAAVGFSANAQVPRMPFIEHFTQASCGPCASQNPALKVTLDNFGTANYVKVTHQTSWPGVDPMNAEYPAGPNDRRGYYSVTGVPDASLNGGATDAPNTAVTTAKLNAIAAQTTPYEMELSQTWISLDTLKVDLVIRNTTAAAVAVADRLHLSMVENFIGFSSAPGSNGETEFYYVQRNMYNIATGASSTAGLTIGAIPANDSLTYSLTLTSLPTYIRDKSEISFAAYLQNQSTKVVHQAAKSMAGGIPGYLTVAATSASIASTDLCDANFTPAVNFANNGADPITSVDVQYTINGGTPVTQTYTPMTPIMQGQSASINFAAIVLPLGSSAVNYEVTDVNAGGLYAKSALIIPTENYAKINPTSVAAPLAEGFETSTLLAGTGYVTEFNQGIFITNGLAPNMFSGLNGPSYSYGAIGGFGRTNRSIRFRAYSIGSGNIGYVMMNKVDLTNSSEVSFDYSYSGYAGTDGAAIAAAGDRIDVEVSTDCGQTWSSSLWSRQGAGLQTTPSLSTTYTPTSGDSAQWMTAVVDLSAYDNTNEVSVRLKFTSAFGNNIFVDNINIAQSIVGSTTAITPATANMTIIPNPVSNYMTVQFTMEEMTEANVAIFNTLGQQVQQVANRTFEGQNNLNVNTTELASGVYFLNVTSEKGTSTKRFVVEK